MRIGSLFSGIGGLELGLEMSGLGRTVWQVEQSEFCRAVLAKHWPEVERYEDVREVGKHSLSRVDVICGGFPCTDISSAGKGAGLAGERSGLWFEYARIIEELVPAWVVVENVSSGAKRWADQVSWHLGELGYETLPIPITAEAVGAPHQRARIFIVGRRVVADTSEDGLQEGLTCGHAAQEPTAKRASVRGATSDSHDNRKSAAPINAQAPWVQEPAKDGGWQWRAPCSPVCRVDDDVPGRMDRLKALGNAVVPQCAVVVGHVIQLLIAG